MSVLFPFRALRPAPESAAAVASVPYDVVNAEEARALAAGNPLSFLHVTRSEIDLPEGTSPYDASVYEQAVRSFEELKRLAPLVLEDEPSLYVYRLRMGQHEQTGVAGCFSVDEYDRGLVKKHEKTRPDKEDDRTRHIMELRAQTGVVFLTYRARAAIDEVVSRVTRGTPVYDLVAPDGVTHTVWRVTGADCDSLVRDFAALDATYIADGHHRAASASRARRALAEAGARAGDADRFVAVAFPDDQVQVLAYNRTVRDLGEHSVHSFLAALREVAAVDETARPAPARRGEVSMFLVDRWYGIRLPEPTPGGSRADALDVQILQRQVLTPLLGVADPRSDERIDFVGGIRGPEALERIVVSGRAAVAFSMYPVLVDDLIGVADAGGIMPPKSTWFEPKLRDGLLIHLI
jgi:uncharacterized protein (DUF1015 family)